MIISLVIMPSLTRPLGPVGSPLYKIATGVNPDLANEVGWSGFFDTAGQVVATVPAAELNHTIVLSEAYQQAGALELLRPATAYTSRRCTPAQRLLVLGTAAGLCPNAVVTGDVSPELLSRTYAHCDVHSAVATPPGVRSDLTGVPVRLCTGRLQSWSVLWPELRLIT